MSRAWSVVLLAFVIPGCVAPPGVPFGQSEVEPSHWSYDVEPAMAPDFSGEGATFPVLLIHQHHVPSKRQQEAQQNVVCLTLDGDPLPLERPRGATRDALTYCPGPAADPPTGRVFVDRDEFVARQAEGLAVFVDRCNGGVVHLGAEQRGFRVRTPAHEFVVRLEHDGRFSVDGRWIEPGTTLKVGYYISYGSEEDEQYVRVAFEAPGRWRVSGLSGDPDASDGRIPARPDRGTGLAADVALVSGGPIAPLAQLLSETPGEPVAIESARVVHEGDRLTELALRVGTREGVVSWYGAGRDGGTIRVLGAYSPQRANESAVPVEAFVETFDLTWDRLATPQGSISDVRLTPSIAWSTAGPLRVSLPGVAVPCSGDCVLVREQDEWRQLLAPRASDAVGALTLEVVRHAEDARETTTVWWHAGAHDDVGGASPGH